MIFVLMQHPRFDWKEERFAVRYATVNFIALEYLEGPDPSKPCHERSRVSRIRLAQYHAAGNVRFQEACTGAYTDMDTFWQYVNRLAPTD